MCSKENVDAHTWTHQVCPADYEHDYDAWIAETESIETHRMHGATYDDYFVEPS